MLKLTIYRTDNTEDTWGINKITDVDFKNNIWLIIQNEEGSWYERLEFIKRFELIHDKSSVAVKGTAATKDS